MNLPQKKIELQRIIHPKENDKNMFNNSQLIVENAFGHLPEIQQQKFLVEAAKKQVSITKSFLLPSLNLGAGYSTGFYEARKNTLGQTVAFKTQINDNASKYISASLSIPIFSGLQKRHQIKVSKINVLKAENNLLKRKQELQQEIEATIQKSQALFLEKKMTQKSIEAKELEFVIAQKKFKNGLINLFELSQTKKEFIAAKVSFLNVSFQLISTNWLLNYYQNNTLN